MTAKFVGHTCLNATQKELHAAANGVPVYREDIEAFYALYKESIPGLEWKVSMRNYPRRRGTCYINPRQPGWYRILIHVQGMNASTVCHELAHVQASVLGSRGTHDRTFAQCFEAILRDAEGVLFHLGDTVVPSAAPVPAIPAKPDPTWVLVFRDTNEIVKPYHRKPSWRRIVEVHQLWVRGRQRETIGRLEYMTYSDYLQRKERIDLA